MPIQRIIDIKSGGTLDENIALTIALNCAPLIKNKAFACIISVDLKMLAGLYKMIIKAGIKYLCFGMIGDKVILYLYRQKPLKEHLATAEIREFLAGYGYGDPEADLRVLSEKMRGYISGSLSYPHEIGVFFGYPLEDVKDFIGKRGEGCLYCGYWKVYHNLPDALKVFEDYDKCRDMVAEELLVAGKTLCDIAV